MDGNMGVLKQDWAEAKERMTDWWAGKKVDRTVAGVTAPVRRDTAASYINKAPDKYTDPHTVFVNLDRRLESTFWGAEAFPWHFVYFGPMYGTMVYFGAKPVFTPDTTWYEPCFDSLDAFLDYEPDPRNEWWKLVTDMTRMSAERSRGRHLVSNGGLSAAIDALAGLIGNEALLCAMVDEPEKVTAARDKILKYYPETFDESYGDTYECNSGGSIDWLGAWTPGKADTNQCDLCVMISPAMFDRFVFDDMKTAFDHLDHGIYHLDGEEQIKHLDSLLKIDKLHMIQWVPSTRMADPYYTDPMNWIPLFKRIQDAGRKVFIYTPYHRVKALLNKIDRGMAYLSISCPDEQTARQAIRDLA